MMRRRFNSYDDFVRDHLIVKDKDDMSPITISIIIALCISYILELLYLVPNQELFQSLMTNPMHLLEGNYYSIFTSLFLHADIFHLLTNCIALYIFGSIVERNFGIKTLFVFVGSGIIANLVSHILSFMTNDLFSSLGASGAIAGLIIFAILLEPFAFTKILIVPLPIFLFGWVLIASDLIGLTNPSQVNHFAHIGGYLALLILFYFMEFNHRRKIIVGFTINLALLLLSYILIKVIDLEKIRIMIGF